jgi:hypothetical protein
MLHACFTPFASCFVYTSWRFYAISGTNLLTRCHNASSLLSAIFVFQKSYIGNILGIGQTEDRNSYYSRTKDMDRKRTRGGPEGSLTMRERAPSWPRPLVVRPPWSTSDDALSPIKSFGTKKPRMGIFPRTVPQHRRRRRQILRDRSLYSGTLPGWGSAPGAISIGLHRRLCLLHRHHRHLHCRCCLR